MERRNYGRVWWRSNGGKAVVAGIVQVDLMVLVCGGKLVWGTTNFLNVLDGSLVGGIKFDFG